MLDILLQSDRPLPQKEVIGVAGLFACQDPEGGMKTVNKSLK